MGGASARPSTFCAAAGEAHSNAATVARATAGRFIIALSPALEGAGKRAEIRARLAGDHPAFALAEEHLARAFWIPPLPARTILAERGGGIGITSDRQRRPVILHPDPAAHGLALEDEADLVRVAGEAPVLADIELVEPGWPAVGGKQIGEAIGRAMEFAVALDAHGEMAAPRVGRGLAAKDGEGFSAAAGKPCLGQREQIATVVGWSELDLVDADYDRFGPMARDQSVGRVGQDLAVD